MRLWVHCTAAVPVHGLAVSTIKARFHSIRLNICCVIQGFKVSVVLPGFTLILADCAYKPMAIQADYVFPARHLVPDHQQIANRGDAFDVAL